MDEGPTVPELVLPVPEGLFCIVASNGEGSGVALKEDEGGAVHVSDTGRLRVLRMQNQMQSRRRRSPRIPRIAPTAIGAFLRAAVPGDVDDGVSGNGVGGGKGKGSMVLLMGAVEEDGGCEVELGAAVEDAAGVGDVLVVVVFES